MKSMKPYHLFLILLLAFGCKKRDRDENSGCRDDDSDDKQRAQQEKILEEATAQAGMPAITNFRERKILKDILELRDQTGLTTYTYLVSELNAQLVFLCDSVGYGIPYATQYTNPLKPYNSNFPIANADPNGLFSPDAAEGTWVMCNDPGTKSVQVVYVEPRIIVSPFQLPDYSVHAPTSAEKE